MECGLAPIRSATYNGACGPKIEPAPGSGQLRKDRKMKRFALLAAALFFATAAWGQVDLMGKEAPDFTAENALNPTDANSLEDCRGEVVLIKYWGTQ